MAQAAPRTAHSHAPVTTTLAAFGGLAPITPEYPTVPIEQGFNWTEALDGIDAGWWYLVVFRSVRKAGADEAVLAAYDDRAHREALSSDGLLFYFQGQLSLRRECLSFCIWQSQAQAQAASRLPLHQEATDIVAQMYESYRLERYHIRKEHGGATLSFEPIKAPVR